MNADRSTRASAAGRKAWQAPRLVRLESGSAESGQAAEEDGTFTAS